ncbi:hypothetical protein BGZ96_001644 [Linnemannia gamsii]|uniref:Uncharacterized protein n=1 Tax=Linnemannia gamsii TaxID=64522 RepID=A0ABQ7JLW8_9FUNG|nr:hypothetical protein BGZ96_001644 [Linnemannia gamsii]
MPMLSLGDTDRSGEVLVKVGDLPGYTTFGYRVGRSDCNYSGRTGFLMYLRKLTKLGQLQASVYASTAETKVMTGCPEARKIAKYWLNLEITRFFEANEKDKGAVFWWLQSQSKEG